uniref:Pleckstrin homology domain-containing family M member 2 n=1 Tax=Leptobrachium leishanense TaxID=445787 RepID=A0A8C5QHB5_9ANUR
DPPPRQLQSYFAACEDETPAIRNHDRVLQRLCEHLDHALLYGLQDISSGYWVLVVHFTRRNAVKQIEDQQHVATHLGRSRAWLYLALNENSLESYLRLFYENKSLLEKYYYKNALVRSHDHLALFLTLVSGLEFIRFDLELDAPYLDLAPYMPEYYKPQYLLDFEDRLPSSTTGSDSLSLNSFNSNNSANLEWDDSAIAPSSEDGDLLDGISFPCQEASLHSGRRAHEKHIKARFNPFTPDLSSSDVTPGLVKKKRNNKRRKIRSEDGSHRTLPSTSEPEDPSAEQDNPTVTCNGDMEGKPSDIPEAALRLPKMQDTSMERVGQPLSDVIEKLNDQLDPHSWSSHPEPTDQSFRTCSPGQIPGGSESPAVGQGMQDPMDFYYFTPESPDAAPAGGGYDDSASPSQPAHVFSGSEDARQGEEGRGERAGVEGPVETQTGGKSSPELSIAEDSGVEEGQGSPADSPHPCEFRYAVDNNLLLLLMIHVFRENEEQLFKMFRMSTGHMEGDLQMVYVLLTDCYIYLLRKGKTPYPTTNLTTSPRRQFLVDTADLNLTEVFIAALQSAMINGCREPLYPEVLHDATMERLALAKFVSQESKREASDVVMLYYGLVHWEDPLDDSPGSIDPHCKDHPVSKEGVLYYKASTSYLGRETWKPCFVVLSNGILYQYLERTDRIPVLSVNLGGEQCGGCKRANSTERAHSFQVILSDKPSLELSAASDQEMAEWMLHLCQAVSKGVSYPPGIVPSPCLPCCLVLTQDKLITCHQDCQTSFFRALGVAELQDVSSLCTTDQKEYCIVEFALDHGPAPPPWTLYFSCRQELHRFISALRSAWKEMYQVDLPHKPILIDAQKKCEDALSLIHSSWQRSDSLNRGRSSRDPWC